MLEVNRELGAVEIAIGTPAEHRLFIPNISENNYLYKSKVFQRLCH